MTVLCWPVIAKRKTRYRLPLFSASGPILTPLPQFETRDPKTGDIVRYNADDDTTTLGDMLRQERFGAGMSDQKDLDMQFAQSIMTDGGFKVSPITVA